MINDCNAMHFQEPNNNDEMNNDLQNSIMTL